MSVYCDPADVVEIRVYEANNNVDGSDWCIDGIDRHGRYTESCWTGYANEDDANAEVPSFCVNSGITIAPFTQTIVEGLLELRAALSPPPEIIDS